MASIFAPPTRRGDFLYSSLLYADAGNSNHHPRASVAELAALLRPEAPNLYSRNRQPELSTMPAKDPPWHFYTAQLIHYGLPVTKDKNAAKVRLLNALNQFKLEVPAWVLGMEGELRKEWEGENRKLKGKKSVGSSSSAGAKGGNKGVKGEGSAGGLATGSSQGEKGVGVNVTVNLTLSSGLSMVEQLGVQKASPTKRKRADSDGTADGPKARKEPKIAAVRVKSESKPKKAVEIKSEPTTTPTSKRQVKNEISASTPARSRVKQEPNSPRSSHYIKPDPYTNYASQPPSRILLSGTYATTFYCTNPLYDNDIFTLILFRDPQRSIWWATFSWGPLEGLIQMNPGPGDFDTLGRPCSLGWRLRDTQDNSLTFGRKCTGEMTFFADQKFEGALYQVPYVGTVEIQGTRQVGPSLQGDYQYEWDAFVSEAYGR